MDTQKVTGRRQRGVSLIELMVAMLISLFLLLGAVTVFNQSQSTYRASESVARLQETARLAMNVVETDIRMANFWGMKIVLSTSSTAPARARARPPSSPRSNKATCRCAVPPTPTG